MVFTDAEECGTTKKVVVLHGPVLVRLVKKIKKRKGVSQNRKRVHPK